MAAQRILISDEVAESCAAILRANGFEVKNHPGLPPEQLHEKIADFDGLIVRSATKVTAELIGRGKKLKVIGRAGAGVDNIDVGAATRQGIAVFNTAAANTLSAVEHTLALMLALARQIPRAHLSMLNGNWERNAFMGMELFGKTLGLIGLGKIGREVAARARTFGMRVLACDPFITDEAFARAGVQPGTLSELFRESDFISIHVPLMKATRHLIGEEQFKICKSHLRIINTARGGVINENALYQAIKDGRVAGAALDVFEKEPPGDNPLIGLPNVITTPHLGASTVEAQQRVAEEIAQLLVDFLLYKKVENMVNPEVLTVERRA